MIASENLFLSRYSDSDSRWITFYIIDADIIPSTGTSIQYYFQSINSYDFRICKPLYQWKNAHRNKTKELL